jgi:hypothetical protein
MARQCPQYGREKASLDLLRKGKWNRMKTSLLQQREVAETLAIQALAFIAEEPERLARNRILRYPRRGAGAALSGRRA